MILSEPWPILPAMLPFQEIVSKAHVEKVGAGGMADQVNGTGPFKLVEWRRGDSVIMERFDGYYGGATDIPPVGKACVDRERKSGCAGKSVAGGVNLGGG